MRKLIFILFLAICMASTALAGTQYNPFTDELDITGSGGGGGISNVVEDTTPQLGGQLDVNGNAIGDGTNELLTFTEDASAVNQVNIENQATGSGPIISSAGDDTNIDLNLSAKGTGNISLGNFVLDADQTVGAGQDNYVLTYDNAGGLISLEAAAGGGGSPTFADITANSTDQAGNTIALTNTYDLIFQNSAGSEIFRINETSLYAEIKYRLQHQGDTNTYLSFTIADKVDFGAGGYAVFQTDGTSGTDGYAVVNPYGYANHHFRVNTNNINNAFFVDGTDDSAYFDASFRGVKSATPPKTCNSTYEAYQYYDTDLKEYCYCDATNWVQFNDTSTTCS